MFRFQWKNKCHFPWVKCERVEFLAFLVLERTGFVLKLKPNMVVGMKEIGIGSRRDRKEKSWGGYQGRRTHQDGTAAAHGGGECRPHQRQQLRVRLLRNETHKGHVVCENPFDYLHMLKMVLRL